MSTQSLSSVAIDVVGQYHLAGQHLARAYQNGVQRAAGAINERFAAVVQRPSLPFISEAVKSSLIDAQQHLAGIVAGGLRAGSAAIAATNDRVADGMKAGIERLAEGAARIEAALDTNAAGTVALLGLPSAQLSLSVASALADRAKRLSDAAVAPAAGVVEVPAAPRQARRTTRRR